MVNISDFGATGDGVFMNTAAFAQAIAVAKEKRMVFMFLQGFI